MNASPGVLARGVSDIAARRFWMWNGLGWLLLCLWCWGAWILGPNFKANVIGRELAPAGYVYFVRSIEAISALATLAILYRFVLQPWLRLRRLSFDGLFVLSCWMLYIQEPWLNYNQTQFLYTTVAFNVGSWCGYIPGWNSPHPELMPVGSLLWCTAYLTLVAMPAIAGSRFMSWVRGRRPEIGLVQLIGVTFATYVLFDVVLESFILRTGLFNYASTVPALTLWAGQPHQFPLYEIVSWCGTYTGLACLHQFRNDKGQSRVERGIDALKLPQTGRTGARFLAIMGACQLIMLATYNIPYQYWSLQGGAFPDYPLYRTAGICGPQTDFDCPAPAVPVARRQSWTNRIAPDSNRH